MDWPADAVERRPVASLVPYARNARTHSDEQVAQLMASIREWGWTMPVLVDEAGGIIAGHGRVLAAARLGIAEVPVMIARGWSEAQKRAYVIADNKLALNAGWNEELLRIEVGDLAAMGFDVPLLAFSEAELKALSYAGEADALPDDVDDIPAAPAHIVTRPGDLWQLGRHRLICGDCRDASAVARVLAGRKINIGFTSPPYAEQREYDEASGFRPIPPDQYVEWFAPVAANVAAHLADDGSWFVNIKAPGVGLDTDLYVFDLVIAHARRWGWHFATEFCWERGGVPKSVQQRFKNQFEPIYQFARNRWKMRPDAVRHKSDNVPMAGGPGIGDTSWAKTQGGNGPMFGAAKKRRSNLNSNMTGTQGAPEYADRVIGPGMAYPGNRVKAEVRKRKGGTTELMSGMQGGSSYAPGEYIGPGLAYPGNRLPTFAGSHEATGHAAAFPVGLPQFFALAYTDADDLVFDPFSGSGSTIIAAAHSNRAGAGCEISPSYCDIIVARFRNQFGDEPVILADDGRSYDEVAAGRLDEQKEVAA
jgi:DNA methylase/ParB/Sulfiredoxin domain